MQKTDTKTFAFNHGLTEEEYNLIVATLQRDPNHTEVGILGAMWSEHCSYKSSKIHLKKLPTKGKQVIQGPGENAGIVDLGDDLCAVFKMESHNHPSYIEPYQGAATGVGGIIRDIFTMGARPVALLDSLRFGNPDLPKTKFLIKGVVSGIADYGNCIGIPTVGGEVYFDDCYNGNPLVNVFCLGITKKDKIFKGYASGIGNPVIYVGSKTGRDGIQGAIMASDSFTSESEQKRPAVQVGDPFTEKLLLEACLELFETDCVVGIQDMGAAGLISSSTEMADRGQTGLDLWMEKVPRREKNMTPYEVLLSESQERMLMVLNKGKEKNAKSIFKKWGLDFSIIGEVTDTKVLRIFDNNDLVASLPIDFITNSAPSYDRPYTEPVKNIKSKEDIKNNLTIEETFMKVLTSPTITSKRWIFEQYDYMVRTNTMFIPLNDSAVLNIKRTNKGIAITSNCNSRYCYLDPREGAKIAVAESARNLACSGALPLAITDCLNFGNPEKPEIMWQFKESIEGMKEACLKLNTPVVSGNVSFYNETEGESVYPTPTIGMVGLIKDLDKTVNQWFKSEGDLIAILGDTYDEIDGSEYQKLFNGNIAGMPPKIDLDQESNLIKTLIELANKSIINSAHDLSEGGIAVALAECCFSKNKNFGFIVNLDNINVKKLNIPVLLFSESQSRCIVSINKNNLQKLKDITSENSINLKLIGVVGGNKMIIENILDLRVEDVYQQWDKAFEEKLR
jgi:phosphoribosylformylglycinamidine synthase